MDGSLTGWNDGAGGLERWSAKNGRQNIFNRNNFDGFFLLVHFWASN